MESYKITQYNENDFNDEEYDFNEHENEILIIRKPGRVCLDITAEGIRIVPILRKIEKSLTDAGLAGKDGLFAGWFGEWADELTDRRNKKYFIWNYSGRSDEERGVWSYSWGIEQYDNSWYIFLILRTDDENDETETDEAPAQEIDADEIDAAVVEEIENELMEAPGRYYQHDDGTLAYGAFTSEEPLTVWHEIDAETAHRISSETGKSILPIMRPVSAYYIA